MNILENVPLAPLTTLRVGGPARYFAEPKTAARGQRRHPVRALAGAFPIRAGRRQQPGDFRRGLARPRHEDCHFGNRRAQWREKGKTLFEVGAGEEWDRFVARAIARNCAGIECLSGIPGSVGGTPVQNVGAYGQEVAETITSVLTLDFETDRFANSAPKPADFSIAPASSIPASADVSSSCA